MLGQALCISGYELVDILTSRAARPAERDMADLARDGLGIELGEPLSGSPQFLLVRLLALEGSGPPGREPSKGQLAHTGNGTWEGT